MPEAFKPVEIQANATQAKVARNAKGQMLPTEGSKTQQRKANLAMHKRNHAPH